MLAVQKMTGCVVSCALDSNRRAITKSVRFKLLPDVAHPRAEITRPGSVLFIISQQVSVRGEHRAAPAGVSNNGRIAAAESIYVLSGQDTRAVELAGMCM